MTNRSSRPVSTSSEVTLPFTHRDHRLRATGNVYLAHRGAATGKLAAGDSIPTVLHFPPVNGGGVTEALSYPDHK